MLLLQSVFNTLLSFDPYCLFSVTVVLSKVNEAGVMCGSFLLLCLTLQDKFLRETREPQRELILDT